MGGVATTCLIPKGFDLVVFSDGLLGNAPTAAFTAKGLPAQFSGGGAVSFDHMPNAGLDEIAEDIFGRHDFEAVVLFLQLNGLHSEDGDYKGEPDNFRAARSQFVLKL